MQQSLKNRQRGAAMLAAIMFLLVAAGIITLIFTSTLSEIRQSGDDIAIVKSLTLARGGANLGGRLLNTGVRDDLQAIALEHASTVNRWPFGDNSDLTQPEPTPATVISDLADVTNDLQQKLDARLCGNTLTPAAGHVVTLTIFVTEKACGDTKSLPNRVKLPAPRFVSGSVRTYAVPYVLVSSATLGQNERNIVSQGEYQFTLGGGKFSQFALFTDEHLTQDGSKIWFTERTLFDGPVHSNGTLRFHNQPWFGGKVTSAGCTSSTSSGCSSYNRGADFYSHGFVAAGDLSSSPSYGSDAPELSGGVDWNSSYVSLPTNALDQKEAANDKGLLVNSSLYSLDLYAGDSSENVLSPDGSGGWTPAASQQYIKACTAASTCETYRYGSDKTLYKKSEILNALGVKVVTWTKVKEDFNGVIYVEGAVERMSGPGRQPAGTDPAAAPPALASFGQITVVPEGDLRLTGDLKYEDPPCTGTPQRVSGSVQRPDCSNINAKNVLGIFSPTNEILIGSQNSDAGKNAPDNITIHASLMAAQKVIRVENHDVGAPRGAVNLLGGLIQKQYGAFGRFDSSTGTQTHGYKRSFSFDQRMGLGFSPPFFPGTNPSTVQGVFVYSFGQREQAY